MTVEIRGHKLIDENFQVNAVKFWNANRLLPKQAEC